MKINSARQAWHDAFYQPWDSVMSYAIELAKLGASVQTTEKQRHAGQCVHQTLSGHVQRAIATLPGYAQAFGHHLYNPLSDDDHRECAEAAVYLMAYKVVTKEARMSAKKQEKALHVAAGVLYRYRRMHQGGASACPDPMAKPEHFRDWLVLEKGCMISKDNFAREWETFIEACFAACNDIDKQALAPVALCIGEMKEAA